MRKQLIQQFISGNEEAFEKLYAQYKPVLCKFIQTFINDSTLTDDIVQEVFVAVWLNRKNIDPDKSFSSYLMTSARNKAYDFFKETAKNRQIIEQRWLNFSEAGNDTEEALVSIELDELIDSALKQLSSRKRAIFELAKLKGKSHSEIAEELGISKNTVKNHMVDSLKYLKEVIGKYGEIAMYSLLLFFFV
nr:RNA polymerase sigma-70 factor [uncultured Draconibacterium sp.]